MDYDCQLALPKDILHWCWSAVWALPLTIALALTAPAAFADTQSPKAQALQQVDCEWWDYVTQFAYEDYAILTDLESSDPIASLKTRVAYADYHEFSAGRAMLDAVLSGLQAESPMSEARNQVADLCYGYPADAVHPEFVHAPMLGDTL